MRTFEKRRAPATPGSIPDVLGMFAAEVRFYNEIAPVVGVRVPRCVSATHSPAGTHLVLEDLSGWTPGADPTVVATHLRALHDQWENEAHERWPWLRRPGAAADLVGDLYNRTWPNLTARADLMPPARRLGERLLGTLADAERAEENAGPPTLCHGDIALRNVFTNPSSGEVAFVDWEDVRAAPGVTDLAWLLVSSTPSDRWDDVLAAYGTCTSTSRYLEVALPAAAGQGFLTLAGEPEDTPAARAWVDRLNETAARLAR